jgi:hypothetical protein
MAEFGFVSLKREELVAREFLLISLQAVLWTRSLR